MAKVLTDNGYLQELEDKERKKNKGKNRRLLERRKKKSSRKERKQRKRNGILPAGRRPSFPFQGTGTANPTKP